MHRGQPVGNRLLQRKWEQKMRQGHLQRLRQVEANIDNRKPSSYSHLGTQAKKKQLETERLQKIEHENRILLEKMNHILQKKNTLDNRRTAFKAKSLNEVYRKRELRRITDENLAMLKRIQAREPHYNHLKWEAERRENERFINNITQYPYESPRSGKKSKGFDRDHKLEPLTPTAAAATAEGDDDVQDEAQGTPTPKRKLQLKAATPKARSPRKSPRKKKGKKKSRKLRGLVVQDDGKIVDEDADTNTEGSDDHFVAAGIDDGVAHAKQEQQREDRFHDEGNGSGNGNGNATTTTATNSSNSSTTTNTTTTTSTTTTKNNSIQDEE